MATAYQPSRFEPVRAYDAPTIWIDSLFDEGVSARTFVNSLFSPASLSAAERSTYITRLKQAEGGGSAAGEVASVLLNPLVWLPFIFRPGAASALSKGARIFAHEARSKPWFSLLHSASETTRGTGFAEAMRGAGSLGLKLANETHEITAAAEAKLMASLSGTGASRLTDREKVVPRNQRLFHAIHGQLAGLHKNVEREHTQAVPRMWARFGSAREEITDPEDLAHLFREWRARVNRGDQTPLAAVRQSIGDRERWRVTGKAEHTATIDMGTREMGEVHMIPVSETQGRLWNDDLVQSDKIIDATPGAREYLNSLHNALQYTMLKTVATDEHAAAFLAKARANPSVKQKIGMTPDLVDSRKVRALYEKSQHSRFGRRNDVDDFGTLDLLMHPNTREALFARPAEGGGLTTRADPEEWDRMIRQSVASRIKEDIFTPAYRSQAYRANTKTNMVEAVDADTFERQAKDVFAQVGATSKLEGRRHVWGTQTLKKIEELFPETFAETPDNKEFLAEWANHGEAFKNRVVRGVLERGRPAWVNEFDLDAADRYLAGARHDYAFSSETLGDVSLMEAQRESLASAKKVYADEVIQMPEGDTIERMQVHSDATRTPPGGFTYLHALDQAMAHVQDGALKAHLYDTVIPAYMGQRMRKHDLVAASVGLTQKALRNGLPALRKFAGGHSGAGDGILGRLEDWTHADPRKEANRLLGGLAAYGYGTHLGGNMSATFLQMTQPWLHLAAFSGGKHVMPAYFGDAASEMYAYGVARSKLGLRISKEQRSQLMKGVFKHPEALGIHDHILDSMDEMAEMHWGDQQSWLRFWTQEVPMIPFSGGELMNRLAAVHTARRLYADAGIDIAGIPTQNRKTSPEYQRFLGDVQHMQSRYNFTSDALSTPGIFMKKPLDNPLLRMFMSFSLRAPVEYIDAAKAINKGKRSDVFGLSDNIPWYVADTARLVGTSAIIYELGKIAGVDLSPGLAVDSMFSAVSDRQSIMDGGLKQLPINVPPALSLAVNLPLGMIKWAGGDSTLMRENFARVLPAGVGLSKFASKAPQLPVPLGLLQKQYADWAHPLADGRVGLYNWDGSLIDYRPPAALILEGLGVDLGSHKKGSEIDGWIMKQREEIVSYRQKALMALAANNIPKLNSVRAEFQKKFQVPLTVSKTQLNAFIKQRNVPRTERILDTFPSDVRPQMRQALSQDYARMGMDRETWLQNETSTRRNAALGRNEFDGLDPGTLDELRRMISESEGRKQPSQRTFQQ